MKALLFKEFRSRSIPERALNGSKTERSIFLQISTIVVALLITAVATPIVESSDKLTYISPWVLQSVSGSNVRVFNAAAFSKDANECSNSAFRLRMVESVVCITLLSSIVCTMLLILEFIDKSLMRSAAVVSFIITFLLVIISLGVMMTVMYGRICEKGALAYSPSGSGYSFGPGVYSLAICVLLMVAAYILLAVRRLYDRIRIREAEEYEEEKRRLKEGGGFDAIADDEEGGAAGAAAGGQFDNDDNYTWRDVEEEVEVTDEDEPTAADWGNDLSVRSGVDNRSKESGGGGSPSSAGEKYRAPPLNPDGTVQKRTKMVTRTVRKRVKRPKPKAPKDVNLPKPARVAQRQSTGTLGPPRGSTLGNQQPAGRVFAARPQSGEARLGIAGAHVAADLVVNPVIMDNEDELIDVDDDEYSVEEQDPAMDLPVSATPRLGVGNVAPQEAHHDAPAKPMTPAGGGLAASPYSGTDDPQGGFVSIDIDTNIDDDFGWNPTSRNRRKKKQDPEMSGWGDLDEVPYDSRAAASSKPAKSSKKGANNNDLDDDDPFPTGPSRAEKKERKRKKRMAYNADDVYVYTSGGGGGGDNGNEFDFQDGDFTGV